MPPARPVNILLVDDRPENLTALEAALADLGQNLVRAASGREALRCLLQQDFAVILLDVQMPEMDGFETAALIRARDRSRSTPIIFITAIERSDARVFEGYEAGAVDYLFKPLNTAILCAKVRAFVELHQTTTALAASEAALRRLNEDLEQQVAARVAQLAHNEARFSLVLEATGEGIYGANRDGNLIFVNPAAGRLLGYRPGTLTGRPQAMLFPTAAAALPPARFAAGTTSQAGQQVFRRQDGSVFIGEYTSAPIWEDGQPAGAVVIFRDITIRQQTEQALEVSHQRFRAVFHQSAVGMAILRVQDNQLLDVNEAWLRLLGYARPEMVGHTPAELRLAANGTAQTLLEAGEGAPQRVPAQEASLRCRSGEARITLLSADPLENYPEPSRLIQAVDITERQRVAATLRTSEERYRTLVENSHDLIQSTAPDGSLLVVNRAWLETLEYTLADVPTLNFWNLIHPDWLSACRESFAALAAGRAAGVLRPVLLTRTGAPVALEGVAVGQYADGRLVAAQVFFRNMTEQRRIEQMQTAQLAVSRILAASPNTDLALTQILEAIGTHLNWQAGELWWHTDASAPLRRLTRWSRPGSPEPELSDGLEAELPGRAWSTGQVQVASGVPAAGWTSLALPILQSTAIPGVFVFAGAERRRMEPTLEAVLADLGRQVGQFVARKEAETALAAERVSLAQRVQERTADLSRANAELAQAVRAKDEFLANMSHELRTPLSAVLAISDGLLEQVRGPLNSRQEAAVRQIESSGEHLLELINDILDLSKMGAERLQLDLELVSINEVCQASIQFFTEPLEHKHLHLHFGQNAASAGFMRADPRRLKQILVNLLSNAIKFTPDGGQISLDVETDPSAEVIRFVVQDSGIGIAPEDLGRLFRPFTQLDAGLNRHHEGSGLGLALVRRLTEMHGGSVTVTSTLGQGSRFTVAFPYPPLAPTDRLVGAESGQSAVFQSAMVVSEMSHTARQTARDMQELPIPRVAITPGATALAAAVAQPPQVIVVDLTALVDPSGWEVLAQLQADARTRAIPVILLLSHEADQERGRAAGARDCLVKPVARTALRQSLTQLSAAPALAASTPAAAQLTLAGVRILMAEDNEVNIMALQEFLEFNGCELVVARNGQEAIDRALESIPHLILMDLQMPKMDGLEAMRQLRARPEFAALPIVALTALAMPGDRERSLAAGATEYVPKPVSLRKLLDLLRRLLAR